MTRYEVIVLLVSSAILAVPFLALGLWLEWRDRIRYRVDDRRADRALRRMIREEKRRG